MTRFAPASAMNISDNLIIKLAMVMMMMVRIPLGVWGDLDPWLEERSLHGNDLQQLQELTGRADDDDHDHDHDLQGLVELIMVMVMVMERERLNESCIESTS